jgi:diketogulonate reductase-like aldo/keto reductase
MQTLSDLGVKSLDLLLMHWPDAWLPGSHCDGPVTPDTETSLLDTWWVGSA